MKQVSFILCIVFHCHCPFQIWLLFISLLHMSWKVCLPELAPARPQGTLNKWRQPVTLQSSKLQRSTSLPRRLYSMHANNAVASYAWIAVPITCILRCLFNHIKVAYSDSSRMKIHIQYYRSVMAQSQCYHSLPHP